MAHLYELDKKTTRVSCSTALYRAWIPWRTWARGLVAVSAVCVLYLKRSRAPKLCFWQKVPSYFPPDHNPRFSNACNIHLRLQVWLNLYSFSIHPKSIQFPNRGMYRWIWSSPSRVMYIRCALVYTLFSVHMRCSPGLASYGLDCTKSQVCNPAMRITIVIINVNRRTAGDWFRGVMTFPNQPYESSCTNRGQSVLIGNGSVRGHALFPETGCPCPLARGCFPRLRAWTTDAVLDVTIIIMIMTMIIVNPLE